MSNYILHNGTFVEVSDEELMHWKYIKREKKNGKWRYYYDEEAANVILDLQKTSANNARAKEFDAYLKDYERKQKIPVEFRDTRKNPFQVDMHKTAKDYRAARRAARRAVAKYERMKVGHAIDKAVSIGTVAVANYLSDRFSKKK
jgi:hypothetical protein